MAKIIDLFNEAADTITKEYIQQRQIISFAEYLAEFAKGPKLHLRDAAGYLLDAIDHFGSSQVAQPWGTQVRYKIFDQEFADPSERLVGQETAQNAVRAAIAGQVRDGRVNRLILIYGPNGSAKSTFIKCLFRGLAHYSRLDEGALYRFRWIFPTRKTSHGTIGFGARLKRDNLASFAHLEDDQIDATVECEVRDHPLLLLPKDQRLRVINHSLEQQGITDYQAPDHFMEASLCHRCRQVADALMRTHQGDIRKVLAHIQVERWAISRRYRRGLVQVGPQMSADASQRQVTADRNLSALPIELQNMTLFETFGPLVDGAGGMVEFEDMLKRPIDAFKYLLGTIETGEVMLGQSILKLNTVLLATTNDDMLEAFRGHHEFPSFRDRLTLVPVPYITQRSSEQRIYELQLVPNLGRHTAPHAVAAVAHWAVLSRLHKPDHNNYPKPIRNIIKKLTVKEKCDLYNDGTCPQGLSSEERALLRESLNDMRAEDSTGWAYEGRYGASPRLIRQVLLRASLSDEFECLSPFAVIEELKQLATKVREHPFLEREKEDGGYHHHDAFADIVEDQVLDAIENDVRSASGLVEESRYEDLLTRYVNHVSHVVKGEKLLSETTDTYEEPDESMMSSVEKKLGLEKNIKEFRENLISRIAAKAIENPGEKISPAMVFPEYLRRLKAAYFEENRQKVAAAARPALAILNEEDKYLEKDEKKTGKMLIKNLTKSDNYCKKCTRDALVRLLSKRFDKK